MCCFSSDWREESDLSPVGPFINQSDKTKIMERPFDKFDTIGYYLSFTDRKNLTL